MYQLRRWNHPTQQPNIGAATLLKKHQQEPQRSSSQIPLQLEIAMKKMNTIHDNDDYNRGNIHAITDEITMEDCTPTSSSTSAILRECYYSISSLFRNHKKVVLQDGLTKCRLARDEPPEPPHDVMDVDHHRTPAPAVTKKLHPIDTSMMPMAESKKSMKPTKSNDEDDDEQTAVETPSPVHTDEETDLDDDDDDTVNDTKFFRRGKLV